MQYFLLLQIYNTSSLSITVFVESGQFSLTTLHSVAGHFSHTSESNGDLLICQKSPAALAGQPAPLVKGYFD